MKKTEGIRDLESVELQEINGGSLLGFALGVFGFAYWAYDNREQIYRGMQAGVK